MPRRVPGMWQAFSQFKGQFTPFVTTHFPSKARHSISGVPSIVLSQSLLFFPFSHLFLSAMGPSSPQHKPSPAKSFQGQDRSKRSDGSQPPSSIYRRNSSLMLFLPLPPSKASAQKTKEVRNIKNHELSPYILILHVQNVTYPATQKIIVEHGLCISLTSKLEPFLN